MNKLITQALALVLLCGVTEAKSRAKALRSFTTYAKNQHGGKKKMQTTQSRQSKYLKKALDKSKTHTYVDFHSAYEVGVKRWISFEDGPRIVDDMRTGKQKPMINLRKKRDNTKSDLVTMTVGPWFGGGWGAPRGWPSVISTTTFVMAHEIGHNLNATHAGGMCGRFYLRQKRATIMQGWSCSSHVTQRFTNPSVKHHGLKLGSKSQDNARLIRLYGPHAASFK